VRIDPGTTGIARRNLVAGKGRAAAITDPRVYRSEHAPAAGRPKTAAWMIVDNIASGAVPAMEGVARAEVAFDGSSENDFTNGSGYGARGWVLKPECFDPDLDEVAEAEKYCHVDLDGDDEEPEEPCGEAAEEFDFESFLGNLFQPD
jgi:hypothetical protein